MNRLADRLASTANANVDLVAKPDQCADEAIGAHVAEAATKQPGQVGLADAGLLGEFSQPRALELLPLPALPAVS